MIYTSILDIQNNYNVFLFDAYGVFNFGSPQLSPTALKVMADLIKQNKKIVILSNVTSTRVESIQSYIKKGLIMGTHYTDLVSSGQYTSEILHKKALPLAGDRVYTAFTANFKNPDDKVPALLKNTPYTPVDTLEKSDFIYCGIPQINGKDSLHIKDFIPEVRRLAASGRPMLCANPDLVASENGGFVIRQGSVCALFEEMGGRVIYYGKPDIGIYERALQGIGHTRKDDVLMVGDTLRTDIRGADNFGIDSCLLLEKGVTEHDFKKAGIALNAPTIRQKAAEMGIKNLTHIAMRLSRDPLYPIHTNAGIRR
jgi:HAD superfamily hydrolase (TIGR01459 family)